MAAEDRPAVYRPHHPVELPWGDRQADDQPLLGPLTSRSTHEIGGPHAPAVLPGSTCIAVARRQNDRLVSHHVVLT